MTSDSQWMQFVTYWDRATSARSCTLSSFSLQRYETIWWKFVSLSSSFSITEKKKKVSLLDKWEPCNKARAYYKLNRHIPDFVPCGNRQLLMRTQLWIDPLKHIMYACCKGTIDKAGELSELFPKLWFSWKQKMSPLFSPLSLHFLLSFLIFLFLCLFLAFYEVSHFQVPRRLSHYGFAWSHWHFAKNH